MSNYLLCASPIYGHVSPMIAIGRHLVAAGHQVRMLTGSRFAADVEAAGMQHISLPTMADYDDRTSLGPFEGGEKLTGIKRLRFDVEHNFIAVMPHQYAGVRAQLAAERTDAVLAETAFTGVIPLLLEPPSQTPRPPVLICGLLPLPVSSKDTAPFGLGLAPSTSGIGRFRNRTLNALITRVVFGRAQRIAQKLLRELAVAPLPCFVMDFASLADEILQLTSPGFEYPRSDLRTPLRFVGPVLPRPASFEPPAWWPDLDTSRPVVHVTQGTIANTDLDQLITPTLRALANRDLLVVATTGDEASAAALRAHAPANARVAAFLPYHDLLPKVDVVMTNGGYGGAQFALAHGVPLIVAGKTEDKPEVAGRVAWSGSGIDLRTNTPTPDAVAAAVNRILTEPHFRTSAGRLRDELAACTPLETIESALHEAASRTSGVR